MKSVYIGPAVVPMFGVLKMGKSINYRETDKRKIRLS